MFCGLCLQIFLVPHSGSHEPFVYFLYLFGGLFACLSSPKGGPKLGYNHLYKIQFHKVITYFTIST